MKTAIVYWSGTGNTEAMAKAVAEGVISAGGEADIITAADFNAGAIKDYCAIAFGCPSMGVEQLEESEFEPMFCNAEALLKGKKVGLFGSYGWGDGEWMRTWEERCRAAGADLVSEGVICNDAPDQQALEKCRAQGNALKG